VAESEKAHLHHLRRFGGLAWPRSPAGPIRESRPRRDTGSAFAPQGRAGRRRVL